MWPYVAPILGTWWGWLGQQAVGTVAPGGQGLCARPANLICCSSFVSAGLDPGQSLQQSLGAVGSQVAGAG